MVQRTVVTGARIFDGVEMLGVGTVVIEDGAIEDVRAGVANTADGGGVFIDGRGQTLLPGLIDAHTHLRGYANLEQSLRYGVTTVLDMFSCPPEMTAGLRRRASHDAGAAGLFSAGLMAGAQGGWPGVMLPPFPSGWRMPGLTGPQDAEPFVAARVAEGLGLFEDLCRTG